MLCSSFPPHTIQNIKFYKQISEQGQMVVVSRDEHKNPFHADAFSRSLFRAACDQLYANTMYVDTVQQAVYSYIVRRRHYECFLQCGYQILVEMILFLERIVAFVKCGLRSYPIHCHFDLQWHHWPLFQASLNTLNAEETKKYAVDRSWEQLKKLEGKDDFLLQNLLPGEAELQALADVYQMPVFVFSVHQCTHHAHILLQILLFGFTCFISRNSQIQCNFRWMQFQFVVTDSRTSARLSVSQAH